jgi:hypothetical protein
MEADRYGGLSRCFAGLRGLAQKTNKIKDSFPFNLYALIKSYLL